MTLPEPGRSEEAQRRARRPLVRQFITFFLGSGMGLLVDLAGFQLLVLVGLEPWLANGISSFTSITVVYVLVSRYSFGADATVKTYVAFVLWYSASIVLFSFLIQTVADATEWPPFAVKLLSVPLSFVLNYAFSRLLFRRRPLATPPEQTP